MLAKQQLAKQQLIDYLFNLRERYRDIDDESFHNALAMAFANVDAWDITLDELRFVLTRNSTNEFARYFGTEIFVSHKIGALNFTF